MQGMIAWRNLCHKPLQSGLTVAVVAMAMAMTVLVMLLASSIQKGLIQAADPFDLIVGAKGSPNQLVLNTVFLQDTPIGNIDYSLTKELAANPLVESAIPMGFGDNYRGYRIVGTEASLFEHRSKAGQPTWLQLEQGRMFQTNFEAVIGAKMAKETGLKIGDTFVSSHGVTAGGHSHDNKKITVVGILQPLQGPYDQAIFVSLASIWELHSHEEAHEHEGVQATHSHEEDEQAAKHEHEEHAHADHAETPAHEHEHEHERGTTVILVKPKGYAEAMRLYQQFQNNQQVQLIFPSQVIVRLFAMLGEGEKILSMISYAVFGMTMLVVAFSLYWSALSRARDRAVLRATGAGWRDIFLIIATEGTVLVWSGVAVGIFLGHGVFAMLAEFVQQKMAVAMPGGFSLTEAAMIAVILMTGIVASSIPAFHSAKQDISANL